MKRPEGFDEHAGADDRRTGPSAAADRPRKPPRPSRGAGLRAALDGVREARRGSGTPAGDEDALRGAGPARDAADGDRVVRRRGEDAVRGAAEQPAGLPELPVVDVTEDDRVVEPTAEPEPAGGPDARVDEGATPGVAPHVPSTTTPIGARVRAAETAREARVARKRRRLLERAEVRRFTRRSRHRRAAWTAAGGVVAVLVVSILVAVYSPLMALRTIEVKGTDRVDAAQVRAALSGQLGTPLARIDLDEVQQRIAGFPLIESYVTEEEPPHTLVVTVTERTPVVAVQSGRTFDLVDPAGIVVQSTTKRPGDMPVADIGRAKLGSPVFRTMTEVVLAMPEAVRAQVSGIGASTTDDVTLSMRDGSSVVWGSPDESAAKAELLAALVADHAKRSPDSKVEFDVSAPDNGIIRPRS